MDNNFQVFLAKGFHLLGMIFRLGETTRFQIISVLTAHAGNIENAASVFLVACPFWTNLLEHPSFSRGRPRALTY